MSESELQWLTAECEPGRWDAWRTWASGLRAGEGGQVVGVFADPVTQLPFFALTESIIVFRDHLAQFAEIAGGPLSVVEPEASSSTLEHYAAVQYSVTDESIGNIVEAQQSGLAVFPNLAYFMRPMVSFRPDELPSASLKNNYSPVGGLTLTEDLIVVDTGLLNPAVVTDQSETDRVFLDRSSKSNSGTPVEVDAVTGHGPAISSILGRMLTSTGTALPEPERWGVRVRYEAGAVGVPIGHATHNQIRAFDTFALVASLDEALLRGNRSNKVISLSLSTPGTSLINGALPGQMWPVADWINDHPEVTIVAAAGNDGTSQENYPAAWNQLFPDRVVAVASHDAPDGSGPPSLSSFSNRGSWVDVSACGQQVEVSHPLALVPDVVVPGVPYRQGWMSWSGTSFATPQVAACIASGMSKNALMQSTGNPSGGRVYPVK